MTTSGSAAVALLLALSGACDVGGGMRGDVGLPIGDGGPPPADAGWVAPTDAAHPADATGPLADAGQPADAAAPTEHRCGVPGDYGDLPTYLGASFRAPHDVSFLAGIGPDGGARFTLELIEGSGIFADGFREGSFDLSTGESSYDTCGACIRILADSPMNQTFMPSSGQLVLERFEPDPRGALVGELRDVTLREVEIEPGTFRTHDVEGGCTTHIAALGFDMSVVPSP